MNGPRITLEDIEANITSEHYFTGDSGVAGERAATEEPVDEEFISSIPAPLHLLTFCVLVLKNGFSVVGESACVSPQNFDREIGRKIARENALEKVWPLMGYELRTALAKAA